ncbi:D-glycero-alpha-D-manno-heptose-1,7-bisphosphate 7-phosphatase [Methylotuvimicrobium sp. KM1]|uniref:D-glycero-alpha-D-manno-heptose-1,7-bisphosphate 7-phosphatase n=1 Tax=Methylotuvimicrobium sp. KM1 TaxID=3377707 RepID=UPI003850FFA7
MEPKRALFLDRDGVINHDGGYICRPDDFEFIEGIFELATTAVQLGYLLIVVTNQAGIGRGYYTEQDFFNLTDWMCARFAMEGAPITEVFFCPYHPEHGIGSYRRDSFDRKPNPGMILTAAKKYDIDLASSVMLGDKASDIEAAVNAGIGVRCHYIPVGCITELSEFATISINLLTDASTLL